MRKLLAIAILLFLPIALAAGDADSERPAEWRAVRSWTVTSLKTTETFRVSATPWRVRWVGQDYCTFSVYDSRNELVTSAGGEGSDWSMVYARAGVYHLELATVGLGTFFVEEPIEKAVVEPKAPAKEKRANGGLAALEERGGAAKPGGKKVAAKRPAGQKDYAAKKGLHVFHRPECELVAGEPGEALRFFRTPEEAAKAGMKPCKKCQPPTAPKGGLPSLN